MLGLFLGGGFDESFGRPWNIVHILPSTLLNFDVGSFQILWTFNLSLKVGPKARGISEMPNPIWTNEWIMPHNACIVFLVWDACHSGLKLVSVPTMPCRWRFNNAKIHTGIRYVSLLWELLTPWKYLNFGLAREFVLSDNNCESWRLSLWILGIGVEDLRTRVLILFLSEWSCVQYRT